MVESDVVIRTRSETVLWKCLRNRILSLTLLLLLLCHQSLLTKLQIIHPQRLLELTRNVLETQSTGLNLLGNFATDTLLFSCFCISWAILCSFLCISFSVVLFFLCCIPLLRGEEMLYLWFFCTSCLWLCHSLYSAWPCQRFLVCHIMLVLSISCGMNQY